LANEVIGYSHKNGFILVRVCNMSYNRAGIAIRADFLFKKYIGHVKGKIVG